MMKLSHVFALAALTLTSGSALAANVQDYNQKTFDTLNKQGKPIVVDISATWCPTCKAQKSIIDQLSRDPAFNDVTLMHVDFDKDKPVLKTFRVAMQSTLIAFRQGKEVTRSVGDTSPEGLRTLFEQAAK